MLSISNSTRSSSTSCWARSTLRVTMLGDSFDIGTDHPRRNATVNAGSRTRTRRRPVDRRRFHILTGFRQSFSIHESLLWNDFNTDRRLVPVFNCITYRYLTPFSKRESLSVGRAYDLRGFCKEKCLHITVPVFDSDGAGSQIDLLQLTNCGL